VCLVVLTCVKGLWSKDEDELFVGCLFHQTKPCCLCNMVYIYAKPELGSS
jgi:hypothetical protein